MSRLFLHVLQIGTRCLTQASTYVLISVFNMLWGPFFAKFRLAVLFSNSFKVLHEGASFGVFNFNNVLFPAYVKAL